MPYDKESQQAWYCQLTSLAHSVDSFKIYSTQSANYNLLEVRIFLGSFVATASVKIDVNKFFRIISRRLTFSYYKQSIIGKFFLVWVRLI
jgi:hypothetical protein